MSTAAVHRTLQGVTRALGLGALALWVGVIIRVAWGR